MQNVQIYGAAYGGVDVTEHVKKMVSSGATTIHASNSAIPEFRDPSAIPGPGSPNP